MSILMCRTQALSDHSDLVQHGSQIELSERIFVRNLTGWIWECQHLSLVAYAIKQICISAILRRILIQMAHSLEWLDFQLLQIFGQRYTDLFNRLRPATRHGRKPSYFVRNYLIFLPCIYYEEQAQNLQQARC